MGRVTCCWRWTDHTDMTRRHHADSTAMTRILHLRDSVRVYHAYCATRANCTHAHASCSRGHAYGSWAGSAVVIHICTYVFRGSDVWADKGGTGLLAGWLAGWLAAVETKTGSER